MARKPARKWTPADDAALRAAWAAGERTAAVAARLGVTARTVARNARRLGLGPAPIGRPPAGRSPTGEAWALALAARRLVVYLLRTRFRWAVAAAWAAGRVPDPDAVSDAADDALFRVAYHCQLWLDRRPAHAVAAYVRWAVRSWAGDARSAAGVARRAAARWRAAGGRVRAEVARRCG